MESGRVTFLMGDGVGVRSGWDHLPKQKNKTKNKQFFYFFIFFWSSSQEEGNSAGRRARRELAERHHICKDTVTSV